jgi:hypothetical protein
MCLQFAAVAAAMLWLALLAAHCNGLQDGPLLISLVVEPDSSSMMIIVDVPASWPAAVSARGESLHLPGAFLTVYGVSHVALAASVGLAIDVSVKSCIARVRLTGDMLSSDQPLCFFDTEVSFSQRDVVERLVCPDDRTASCTSRLAFNRSISWSASNELNASGAVIERGIPYVLSSSIAVHGYLLDDQAGAFEVFSHNFPSLNSNWVPVQYVMFRNLQQDTDTHSRWLRVFSSQQQPRQAAASGVARVAHKLHGRLTSQELFYIDHLFSVSPVVDCPSGMRLHDMGSDHAVCTFNDATNASEGRYRSASMALWFSSDTPPASSVINGGTLHVCDCTLQSAALRRLQAFIPWCLSSEMPSLSTLFFPDGSLDSGYSEAASVLLLKRTLPSDPVDVTSTHLPVLKMQGTAGIGAVVHAVAANGFSLEPNVTTSGCASGGEDGVFDCPAVVTLLRLEVDARNIRVLDEVLRGFAGQCNSSRCGILVEQIVATFSISLPYSRLLADIDGDRQCKLALRWPHEQAHCKECVRREWLYSNVLQVSPHGVNFSAADAILRAASVHYSLVAWRTAGVSGIEVTWLLKSMFAGSGSGPALRAPSLLHPFRDFSDGALDPQNQTRDPWKRCIENGVDTCGLAFCSDSQTPIECIGVSMHAFVLRVVEVCARQWGANERFKKMPCAGLMRLPFADVSAGLQDHYFKHYSVRDSKLWGFVINVADNLSLLKLVAYGLWHLVT